MGLLPNLQALVAFKPDRTSRMENALKSNLGIEQSLRYGDYLQHAVYAAAEP